MSLTSNIGKYKNETELDQLIRILKTRDYGNDPKGQNTQLLFRHQKNLQKILQEYDLAQNCILH